MALLVLPDVTAPILSCFLWDPFCLLSFHESGKPGDLEKSRTTQIEKQTQVDLNKISTGLFNTCATLGNLPNI